MEQRNIEKNQSVITYFTEGNGMPLVFIHGFPMDHSAWNEFVQPFTKNFKVILPDNPGFGKSSLMNEEMSMRLYADCIKDILDAEKISSSIMIGHSMGGYMVLNFASRFPEYLKGFGLFHSTTYADDDAKKQNRKEVADNARKMDANAFVSGMLHKLFSEQYASAHEEQIANLKNVFGSSATPEGIAQASLAMGTREDTTELLKNTKVPVLFIIGKEDKVVPPEKTLPLTHLPEKSVVCILENAAHMGMFEVTDQARKAVNDLIELCGD